MADNFQINEYETLPTEPLFKPEPPKSEVPSIGVNYLAEDIKKASQKLLPSEKIKLGTSSLINTFGMDTRTSLVREGIGKEAYTQLSDGTLVPRFDVYNPALSAETNEEILANRQSSGEKWGNGLTKLIGKTGVNVAGGLVGTVNGLIQGVRMQSLAATFDNDLSNYLEDLNKRMDSYYANYRTAKEKDMNFGQKLFTANFLADDLLGGLSFLAGTIISEGIWAAATGGTSLLAKGAIGAVGRGATKALAGKSARQLTQIATKEGKQLIRNTAKNSVENLTKAGITAAELQKGLNTTRFLYTSAGYESAVEAKGYLEEAEAEFINQKLTEEGRAPTAQELGEFRNSSLNASNVVFGANLSLVGFSNFTVLGKMLLGRGTTRKLSNSFFNKNVLGIGFKREGNKLVTLDPTKLQKGFRRAFSVGKPLFTEGVIEEGGQSVVSKGVMEYMLSGYDEDATNDNLSMMDALIEGLKETYTTKEGLTEVGLGALIGLIGGGIATRGRFNEVSQTAKAMEQNVKYVNQYTKDMLINHMVTSNKVARASKLSENAKEKGDLTGEMTYDTAAMAALIERGAIYQNTDEMIKDFQVALDQYDNVKLAEQMDMTEEEVQTWKAEKLNEFKDLADRHTRNLQFAEAVLGDRNIAGLKNIEDLDGRGQADLQSAVAFALTMGHKSDEFAESLATQLKQIVAKDLSPQETTDAISVNSVLQKVGDREKAKYQKAATRVKKIQKDIQNLEEEILKVQSESDLREEGAAQTKATKLTKLNLRMVAAQKQMEEAQRQKDLAFDALNIPQLTDEVVTQDMLDNQEANVKKLQEALQNISLRNPEQNMAIGRIMEEYERAVQQTKTYNDIIRTIVDPKARVSMLNGWAASLINRKKKVNGDTAAMFVGATQNYLNNMVQLKVKGQAEVATNSAEETEEEEPDTNNNPLDNNPESMSEKLQEPKAEETTEQSPEENKGKSVIEILKQKIDDIVKRNQYANARYQGELTSTLEEVKPTQEEIDRYNELLDKIDPKKNKKIIVQREYSPKRKSGLTKAETEELQRLNRKLNNWQILSGFNENNSSIADLLELKDQLESEFEPSTTQTEVQVKDFFKPETSMSKEDTAVHTNLQTIVSPDNPLAKKTDGKYQISHLKIQSIAKLFPGKSVYLIEKGRAVDINSVPDAKLERLNQTPGTEINVRIGDTDLRFVTDERQRLVVDAKSLEEVLPDTEFKILNFGNSNFMPLFVKGPDGNYRPMEGDFTIESVVDNETINLDADKLYELEEGTILRTVVNLNDTYNAQLLEEYRRGQITEEFLINNLNIYVAPQGSVNNIVGTLRAIKEGANRNTDSFAAMYRIRKQAARRAISSPGSRVEVGITVPLSFSLIGNPNTVVSENEAGELVPQNIDLTKEALEMIEDFGYMVDGKLFTNKNLEYSKKDTIFATKTSKKPHNKGKKVPVVVFKYKNRTVVFPVSLKSSTQGKVGEMFNIINNPKLSDAAKIYHMNEVLKEHNIDPKNYGIYDLESEDSIAEVNRMLGDVMQLPDFINVDNWLDPGFDKNRLTAQVEIAIDITDRPFNAPKGILNLKEVDSPTEVEMEIETVNIIDNLAKKVNNIFIEKEPFSSMRMNTKFYDAFEEKGINMGAESYVMKKSNVNTMINAFSQVIPKSVREVLGEKLLDDIRFEIKQYQIINEGLKTNKKAVEEKFGEEIENLENKCN